ncbi:MAG TPA: YciI family protein [Phenylobacterium sp.]|nr:YciI family protein [Phenylobacterium sp.]
MQYMLLIYDRDDRELSPTDLQALVAEHMRLAADMREAGVMLGGDGLQPGDTATTVRLTNGERVLHDGPFPETREQLGGYYLIEVADLDVAVAWARRVPVSDGGGVEVRPVMVY